jgi:hypothetical protein
MEIVHQRNVERATPCVLVKNASDGKAGAMDIRHANTAESALLNATMMKTLVSSQIVRVVGLVEAKTLMSL